MKKIRTICKLIPLCIVAITIAISVSGCGDDSNHNPSIESNMYGPISGAQIIEYYADLGFDVKDIELGEYEQDIIVTMSTSMKEDELKELFEKDCNEDDHLKWVIFHEFMDGEGDMAMGVGAMTLIINGVKYEFSEAEVPDMENSWYRVVSADGKIIVTGDIETMDTEDNEEESDTENAEEDSNKDYDSSDDDTDDESEDSEDSEESSSSGISHYDICYYIIGIQDYYAMNGWTDGEGGHDSFAEAQSHFGITYDQVLEAWTDPDANPEALYDFYH